MGLIFAPTLNNHKRATFTPCQILSCVISFKCGNGYLYNQNVQLEARGPFIFSGSPLQVEYRCLVYKYLDLGVHVEKI